MVQNGGGVGEFSASQANSIGGGYSDGGGASDGQGGNGLKELLGRPAGQNLYPAGQFSLVE